MNTTNDVSKLTRIDHFAKCTCIVREANKQETHALWFVALCYMLIAQLVSHSRTYVNVEVLELTAQMVVGVYVHI